MLLLLCYLHDVQLHPTIVPKPTTPLPHPNPSDPTHLLESQHKPQTALTLANLQTNLARNTPLPRKTHQQSPQHPKRDQPSVNRTSSETARLTPRRGSFMSARAKGVYPANGETVGRAIEPGVCPVACPVVETGPGTFGREWWEGMVRETWGTSGGWWRWWWRRWWWWLDGVGAGGRRVFVEGEGREACWCCRVLVPVVGEGEGGGWVRRLKERGGMVGVLNGDAEICGDSGEGIVGGGVAVAVFVAAAAVTRLDSTVGVFRGDGHIGGEGDVGGEFAFAVSAPVVVAAGRGEGKAESDIVAGVA